MSGCPVVVSEDTSVKTLAASRIAPGANRVHAISYDFRRLVNRLFDCYSVNNLKHFRDFYLTYLRLIASGNPHALRVKLANDSIAGLSEIFHTLREKSLLAVISCTCPPRWN